ncbi:MAG: hypothetical protein MJZ61_01995 [Bacteroidales bacterium]|nr:hypothetical protein [Bacteroidales bacterium]
MNIKLLIYSIIISIAVSVSGCSDGTGKRISEGTITYSIEYPKEDNSSPLISIFPKEMKMRFKDNNTAMEITGYAGSFGLKYITDFAEQKSYALMRIIFKKCMYESSSNEISFGYGKMKGIEITEHPDTMTVCGYLCNKATATIPGKDSEFILWYTPNIEIENPNSNTPFNKVNGVLLKFELILQGIHMKLEAIDIDDHEVADEYFRVPDDYEKVSKEDLEKLIRDFDKSASN